MMTFIGSEFWLKKEIYLKNSSYIIITNAETNQNWFLSDELITFTKWIHLDMIQHWIKRRKRSKDIDTSCTKLVSSFFIFIFDYVSRSPPSYSNAYSAQFRLHSTSMYIPWGNCFFLTILLSLKCIIYSFFLNCYVAVKIHNIQCI